jgi:hypothetical protein
MYRCDVTVNQWIIQEIVEVLINILYYVNYYELFL